MTFVQSIISTRCHASRILEFSLEWMFTLWLTRLEVCDFRSSCCRSSPPCEGGSRAVDQTSPSQAAAFHCRYFCYQSWYAVEQHHHIDKPPRAHQFWLQLNRNSTESLFLLSVEVIFSFFFIFIFLSFCGQRKCHRYRALLALNPSWRLFLLLCV